MPGVSFVVVRRAALDRAAARGFYLDLARHACAHDRRDTPFTPAVHAMYALAEALRELEYVGGRAARHAHYAARTARVREGLAGHGIRDAIAPRDASVVLRAYALPDGVAYADLHDGLKARGFVIYAGQGSLASAIFRIAVMGDLQPADLDRLLAAFDDVVERRAVATS